MQEIPLGTRMVGPPWETRPRRAAGRVVGSVALAVAGIGVVAATGVAVANGSGAIAIGGAGALVVGMFLLDQKVATRFALALSGFGIAAVSSDLVDGLLLVGRSNPGGVARPTALASASLFPLVGAFGNVLMLTFPTGAPVGRWRWLLRAELFAGALGTIAGFLWALGVSTEALVASAFADGPTANPAEYFAAAIFASFPASVTSLLARYRRGSTEERLQIRWLLFSFICVFGVTIVQNITHDFTSTISMASTAIAFLLIPISIGLAILKYRLYDIDRIISRTVAYTIVAAVVAGVYALPVLLIPSLVDASNEFVVAGSTLAAASVFNPVRRRVKRAIDQRFNRARYNAQLELDRFLAGIRQTGSLDGVSSQLTALLGRTLQPSSVALWTRRSP